jgi:hypothetical protein
MYNGRLAVSPAVIFHSAGTGSNLGIIMQYSDGLALAFKGFSRAVIVMASLEMESNVISGEIFQVSQGTRLVGLVKMSARVYFERSVSGVSIPVHRVHESCPERQRVVVQNHPSRKLKDRANDDIFLEALDVRRVRLRCFGPPSKHFWVVSKMRGHAICVFVGTYADIVVSEDRMNVVCKLTQTGHDGGQIAASSDKVLDCRFTWYSWRRLQLPPEVLYIILKTFILIVFALILTL